MGPGTGADSCPCNLQACLPCCAAATAAPRGWPAAAWNTPASPTPSTCPPCAPLPAAAACMEASTALEMAATPRPLLRRAGPLHLPASGRHGSALEPSQAAPAGMRRAVRQPPLLSWMETTRLSCCSAPQTALSTLMPAGSTLLSEPLPTLPCAATWMQTAAPPLPPPLPPLRRALRAPAGLLLTPGPPRSCSVGCPPAAAMPAALPPWPVRRL
jgi:hypothetical protein